MVMRARLRGEDVENVRNEEWMVGALRRIGERRKDMLVVLWLSVGGGWVANAPMVPDCYTSLIEA